MKKRILIVLVCVLAFGWTCLPVVAEAKAASSGTTVSDANNKGGKTEAPEKKEKKDKKDKKHEGKKKGHEKKAEDSNSAGKKA